MSLLQVKNLAVAFRNGRKTVPVIDGISFEIERGEIMALVGESGCGKSAGSLALTRLNSANAVISADSARFESSSGAVELLQLSAEELRKIRGGGIAYIFQEPLSSLNPVFRIGEQIAEVLELHRPEIKDRRSEVIRLLEEVGIPDPAARMMNFPHELSGGMQQRVMIAMALAGKPDLLIADEPTTALDVTIQAQIIALLDKLRRENGTSIILITHNFGVVAQLADKVAVMYAGRIVESAATAELIDSPCHPYTKALLAAVPVLRGKNRRLVTIPGQVPSPHEFPAGCRFCTRCSLAAGCGAERCREQLPPEIEISRGHKVWCWDCSNKGK
ncbi:MAG: ABC transporter ATP-binding protein [Lentisphaeria bacterium]|nr:ABC transporter ATP-binding protein [Lentisphaeria bacterium]